MFETIDRVLSHAPPIKPKEAEIYRTLMQEGHDKMVKDVSEDFEDGRRLLMEKAVEEESWAHFYGSGNTERDIATSLEEVDKLEEPFADEALPREELEPSDFESTLRPEAPPFVPEASRPFTEGSLIGSTEDALRATARKEETQSFE